MVPPAIGKPYNNDSIDFVGVRDSWFPRRALDDHGIAGIIAACSDTEAAVDGALAATCDLYPPLVCQAEGLEGGVVIPVIQN